MSRTREVPVTVLARPARQGWGRSVAVGLVVALAVLLGVGRLGLGHLLPSLPNPFGSKTVDRSQPSLLKSLDDLSRYEAATANLSVIVDTEKDARFLPSFIKGERTVFVAAGSVDATVDFSGLGPRAITVSPDRRSVAISLPAPRLSEARVDPRQSHVASRDRGLLDRLGSALSDAPGSDRQLYLLAQQRMATAAAATDIRARAEQNTRHMLESMLGSLGVTNVTVDFAPNPA
jgi:hypothetical protein